MKKRYIVIIVMILFCLCGAGNVNAETESKSLPSISLQTPGRDEIEEENTSGNLFMRIGIIAGGILVGISAVVIVIIVVRKGVERKKQVLPDNGQKTKHGQHGNRASSMWKDTIRLTDMNDPNIVYSITFDSTKELGNAIIGSGRVKQVDVKILNDNGVSDAHCEFCKKGRMFYVKDLNSTNGTKINGNKIYEETSIISGDTIKIGRRIYQILIRCPLSEKNF